MEMRHRLDGDGAAEVRRPGDQVGNVGQERRPDWVICGSPFGAGQVAIYASTSLTRGELITVLDRGALTLSDLLEPVRTQVTRTTMRVEMTDFVVVVAPTYEQALHDLFAQWSPQGATPLELGVAPATAPPLK